MRAALALACLWLLAAPVAATGDRPVVLVLGDSISAGHGVAVDDGWVARLSQRIDEAGLPHRVVNASIGGDTTSGGRARLPKALERHDPAVVIIQLGGNDGLRGQPLEAMRTNLAGMVEQARGAGARVLLLGIRLPPNYGAAYIERFTAVYRRVARDTGVALVPRVLEGVGERDELMQPDGIHPNAAGHARILDNVWPALVPLLRADAPAANTDGTAMSGPPRHRPPGTTAPPAAVRAGVPASSPRGAAPAARPATRRLPG